MTSAHVTKLTAQDRCPCCGADRERALSFGENEHAEVFFACGAGFLAISGSDAGIVSYAACRNVTAVAAEMLNREIEEEAVIAGDT